MAFASATVRGFSWVRGRRTDEMAGRERDGAAADLESEEEVLAHVQAHVQAEVQAEAGG